MNSAAQRSQLQFHNGLALELAFNDGQFLGIGNVTYHGVPLRSNELPWTVYTESEKGFRFADFRFVGIEEDGDDVTVVFSGVGEWQPRLQAADAMGDARFASRHLAKPTATFRWHFRPIVEQIEEQHWAGIAMQISVESPGAPIHWILEAATWEIGGTANGCTLIQQDVSAIDFEQYVRPGSACSTIEAFYCNESGAWGGSYPMDMMPRAAGAAICDFQVKGDTALCLFAERPSLTRARIDKFSDETVIHYYDRAFVPLGEKTVFPERKLLVYRHPRTLERHEWRNLWLDCFTEVRNRLFTEYDFRLEIPLPAVHAHLWDEELKHYGPSWTEALREALPRYAALGYQEVFTHGVWESVTSDPERSPQDGNICGPYEFRYAEAFGGTTGMRQLLNEAHRAGLQIYQWFGLQFSSYAPIWREHPEWLLREANGDPWDGNYQTLHCGRMNTAFGDYLEESIKTVRDETGLDSVFWDSYHNLGVTCVDWQGPDKAPQAERIWALQSALQRYGYKQRCEAVTIFGVSQVGIFGFAGDKFRRRLWEDTVEQDTAFALLDTSPCYFSEEYPYTPERCSPDAYFWLLAHRAVPIINARPWPMFNGNEQTKPYMPGLEHAEAYARVNRLYTAVLPHMHRLRLMPGGDHVVWLDAEGKPSVAWVFRETTVSYAGHVCDVHAEGAFDATSSFIGQGGHVYLLGVHADSPVPCLA